MSKKKKAVSSLSLEELRAKHVELETQLFKLRMQRATGQLANTSLIRMTRKDLARVKTYEGQKISQAAPQEVKGK
jgi:large subunit ribosomal protein L29